MVKKTLDFVRGLFRISSSQSHWPDAAPIIHHSTNNCWGNHIQWTDWGERRFYGHKTPLPKIGDTFAYRMDSDKVAIFQIIDIDYQSNPRDMFFGEARDIGYADDFPELIPKETR